MGQTSYGSLADSPHNERLLANVRPADWRNPTPNGRYNLVVVGAGTAGLIAAAAAAGLGAKVALIEADMMGGDCLNVGCIPSKSIIRVAKAVGDVEAARLLGVSIPGPVNVDFKAVMERMRRIRADISPEDAADRYRELGVDVYLGYGRFAGPDSITVNDQTLTFKRALIATGAQPIVPPIPGLAELPYLTNQNVFALTELPRRIAIIGGGAIGSELAQTFNRLGSRVTLFDMLPRLLGRDDSDAASLIAKTFQAEGVELCLGATVKQVSLSAGGKRVSADVDGVEKQVIVDEILLAVGRAPNVNGLDLDAAAVTYTKHGVTVNDFLQTSNSAIYAAGDVAITHKFTHAADAAARIVVQNALFMGRKRYSDLVIPWATYTTPEVAQVGLTTQAAADQGVAVDVFAKQLADVHRGHTDGIEAGFVKVLAKKGSDKIVGATVVGPHAGELIAELTLAMSANIGLAQLANVVFPYPTTSEAIKQIADAYNRTRFTPRVAGLAERWLRWRR